MLNTFSRFSMVCASIYFMAQPVWSETDRQACYGDTLEISMPSVYGEGIETEHLIFSLPSPNAWYIIVKDKGNLYQLPCLEEPLETFRVWGGFIDARLGHGDFEVPDIDNVTFRSLSLSSTTIQFAERTEKRWLETIPPDGIVTQSGFVRRVGQNTDAIGGSWLFPKSHPSPIGSRIRMGCALVCEVQYRIRAGLYLEYKFRVWDDSTEPPWIEIDKYVRSRVMSWTKEN